MIEGGGGKHNGKTGSKTPQGGVEQRGSDETVFTVRGRPVVAVVINL